MPTACITGDGWLQLDKGKFRVGHKTEARWLGLFQAKLHSCCNTVSLSKCYQFWLRD